MDSFLQLSFEKKCCRHLVINYLCGNGELFYCNAHGAGLAVFTRTYTHRTKSSCVCLLGVWKTAAL